MLDHAFRRLGLHRVGLSVFAFNERAIRAYQKAGFRIEGRLREAIWRDGHYVDEVQMGILSSEWMPGRREGEMAGSGGAPIGRRTSRRSPARAEGDVSTSGAGAAAARAEVRELIAQKGHAVDNARAAMTSLEAAFRGRRPRPDAVPGPGARRPGAAARPGGRPTARRQERGGVALHPEGRRPCPRRRVGKEHHACWDD